MCFTFDVLDNLPYPCPSLPSTVGKHKRPFLHSVFLPNRCSWLVDPFAFFCFKCLHLGASQSWPLEILNRFALNYMMGKALEPLKPGRQCYDEWYWGLDKSAFKEVRWTLSNAISSFLVLFWFFWLSKHICTLPCDLQVISPDGAARPEWQLCDMLITSLSSWHWWMMYTHRSYISYQINQKL